MPLVVHRFPELLIPGTPVFSIGAPTFLIGVPRYLTGNPARLSGSPIFLIGAPIVLVGAPMVLIGTPIVLVGAPARLAGLPAFLISVPMPVCKLACSGDRQGRCRTVFLLIIKLLYQENMPRRILYSIPFINLPSTLSVLSTCSFHCRP